MMIDITLDVRGEPKAQPRTKATAICPKGCLGNCGGRKARALIRMYTPNTANEWKAAVMRAIKPHVPATPYECTFMVDITFFFKRPQRMMRKKDLDQTEPHGVKPDRDNLDKAVLDALTNAGFWKDDSLACDGPPRKRYTDKRQGTGARIHIKSLEG